MESARTSTQAQADQQSVSVTEPDGWRLVPIEPLLNMMSDKDHETRIIAERQLLAALGTCPNPAAPRPEQSQAMQALDWLDDFVARCNGDDRGSCQSVNLLRAAFSAQGCKGA